METLINPNQINSKPIKILNVVQTGTLTRNGAVYSGFSSSNYLQLGDIVNSEYVSLGNNVKDFGLAISTADSWELVFKTKYKDINPEQVFLGEGFPSLNYGSWLGIFNSKIAMRLYASDDAGSAISVIEGTTTLIENNTYYCKYKFENNIYSLLLSTDGVTYNLENSNENATKESRKKSWTIGIYQITYPLPIDNIDLSESYIKINGEYWWKGVETL
jgi:hypothetical protein